MPDIPSELAACGGEERKKDFRGIPPMTLLANEIRSAIELGIGEISPGCLSE